jgi:hypothetical protein
MKEGGSNVLLSTILVTRCWKHAPWHTPVIPFTQEAEAGGSKVQGLLGVVSDILSQNNVTKGVGV